MMPAERQHDHGILRALRLVHGGRVRGRQRVQLAHGIAERPAVDLDRDLALLAVDPQHPAEVAIVHLAVVIVLQLHHLVAERKADAVVLEPVGQIGVERRLQHLIEMTRAELAPVGRAQDLDVGDRIDAELFGNALGHAARARGGRRPRARAP